MSQSSKLLNKTIVEIARKELQKLGKFGKIANKLQAIIASNAHSITKVADIFGYTRATITSWIKLLKNGDVSGLNDKPKKHRRWLLKEEQMQIIGNWIKEDSNITILGLCTKVKENIVIIVSKSTMHRIMKKLNFSYITPRPKHYKQDVERQKELKKNLQQRIKETENHNVFFFDESRFGTHSKLGHGWFQKGIRTSVKMKLAFQNFYVYTGVQPESGKSFSLILPKVNTDCMNIFLKEFAKTASNEKVFLVMDGAGWHKSKDLNIPTIIFIPPYSPELNPVERLWKYIKQHTIKNKIFDTLQCLEDTICQFLQNLQLSDIRSICIINYLYN